MHTSDQLDLLLTEQEIIRCLTRYARGVDRHDNELIKSAFHSDAIARHGTFAGNPDQLVVWVNGLHSGHTRGHQHFLSNFSFDIQGETAFTEAYVKFVLWRKHTARVDISGGRYVDRFERRGSGWRIADRTVVVDWTSEADQGTDSKGTLAHYPWGVWNNSDLSYVRS
jgi:hypothetical protein